MPGSSKTPSSLSHPAVQCVWTIGHSTRSWEEFLELLATRKIEAIADVRRFPGSRRYPWFASEAMAEQLPEAGLDYRWLPQLGGRRKALAGSANGAWRNAAFQGYADHLASAEFAEGLALALELAARRRTALMCAEAVWWRCHRRLISDLLVHRGIAVEHILDARHVQQHELNPSAVASGDLLVYPPAQAGLFP
ncbi:DUF488 domain-containing protein [uncultured Luteimonas sp.]|uniref:DUF488 domain-containing protein n=1 Tax=uncultured Luteimonas sp. TaxID=453144 RepID=UPI0031F2DD65